MRPMPIPAPMMARPIPMPAPSSAPLLSAAAADSAWSSMSRLCISSSGELASVSVFVLHQPDEDGREQRKDIGLQKRDQQLEKHHEQRQRHRSAHDDAADERRGGAEHKDQTEQHQNDEVPGGHVREQPQ